jgi:hypothetical protein
MEQPDLRMVNDSLVLGAINHHGRMSYHTFQMVNEQPVQMNSLYKISRPSGYPVVTDGGFSSAALNGNIYGFYLYGHHLRFLHAMRYN